MKTTILLLLLLISSPLRMEAKLRNTLAQNDQQYGKAFQVDVFSEEGKAFTGYAYYHADSNWNLVAFLRDGTVRSEHLIPNKDKYTLNRSEVRVWADKMYDHAHRGVYRQQLDRFHAQSHFFDLGLVSYEYNIVGSKQQDFCGVKVILYENDKNFRQINPKAYI